MTSSDIIFLTNRNMLEEYGKYKTVTGKQVHLSSAMRQDDMVHYYGEQLLKIL
jgi:hypothetical protein